MLAATSSNLPAPTAPTITLRTAGSNETQLSAGTYYFAVTAVNYFGETAMTVTSGTTVVGAGQVVDVTLSPVAGAMTYNIYIGTSNTRTNQWRIATGVGGLRYTLQGTVPSSGTNPPSLDSGTGSSNRMEGIVPTLTGRSASSGIYPAGWMGGYSNQSVGTHLSYAAIYTALDALWESTSTSPGAFKADPAELVGDGGDIMRLSTDVISQGAATNYRLFLDQTDVPGVRVGAAVSEFQNPITRSVLKLVVHPWLTQGTALFMTYN